MVLLSWDSVICAHHVHKNVWTPFVGEIVHVLQEAIDAVDHFSVTIVKMRLKLIMFFMKFLCLVWHFI